MEQKKKIYTQAEKIAYFSQIVARLELSLEITKRNLNKARRDLERVTSPDYQDWTSDMEKSLEESKKKNSVG